ncbi:MAG: DUF1015 domain-containing protein [Planctomycetes bacterium]|nr:DUF1015 domain-containing protein [Planctomycetota bacterium]
MLEVAPFRAIRFDFKKLDGIVSSRIAPPYDVLDAKDKSALLQRDPRNIVAIDLPHVPPKSLGPPEAYRQAAETLRQWQSVGTLVQEASPALYLYHQRFEHSGRSYTRRMFIARIRLHPFSDGIILPHERTFGGPKEDRLALMTTTRCNLSPIFGLYNDAANQVIACFDAAASRNPDALGELDGVENRLWIVNDSKSIQSAAGLMASKKLYIADGHHRYGTSLLYRDRIREENGGSISNDHPANYVMFVLASMDDPGCLILPYYRVLTHISVDNLVEAWRAAVTQSSVAESDLVLWDGATGRETPVKFTRREFLSQLEPSEPPAWWQLDYAYLHRYLIDELLAQSASQKSSAPSKMVAGPHIEYVKSLEDARKVARAESGVALLVKATPMAHLRAVSEAGGLMPQKSTYFHPKLATGLTINPLY